MNKRIYINEWLEVKPYSKQVKTDSYYLKLANQIKKVLVSKHFNLLSLYFNQDHISLLSIIIASYLEDIISDTNLWRTFVKLHKRQYGKVLPFYDTKEYYEDEINYQDVSLLLWYFFNTVQEDEFISPENPFFTEMAFDIMEVLDEAYEYAPVNEDIKGYYQIDPENADFYTARNLIDKILFQTYLFFTDTNLDFEDEAKEVVENTDAPENIPHYLGETRDLMVHGSYTRLLSKKGKEWAAEILGEEHPLYKDFLELSPVIKGLFLYKGQDETDIIIEHIASGKPFKLTKKSFSDYELLTTIDTIIYLGIVRWKGEWWFSGIFFLENYNPKVITSEKNSLQSLKQVDFLDYQSKDFKRVTEQQYDIFLKFTKGRQIVFMPADNVDNFISQYHEFYNSSLNLSSKELKEAKSSTGEADFSGYDNKILSEYEGENESALVFFNPGYGVEAAFEVNSAFPLPDNKFFDPQYSDEHIMHLFMAPDISTELAMYCFENHKDELEFFQTDNGKKIAEDLDFLLRFWKNDQYHSEPTTSLIGR